MPGYSLQGTTELNLSDLLEDKRLMRSTRNIGKYSNGTIRFFAGSLMLGLCLFNPFLFASSFSDAFTVVFIDAASEAKYGPFPLDRAYIAKAVQKAAELQARGVVLKFFYIEPRTKTGDDALAQSLTNLPVLLQGCIDESETHPNPLPARFIMPDRKIQTLISGKSGWIPIPPFAEKAYDVGFVDADATRVPLVEGYQEHIVKSLVLCSLELATGERAVLHPGKKIDFGKQELKLDDQNCIGRKLPAKDELAYVPFDAFLTEKIPSRLVKDKVIILGYDGAKIHSLPTAIGPVRAHRVFVYDLQNAYEQIKPGSRN